MTDSKQRLIILILTICVLMSGCIGNKKGTIGAEAEHTPEGIGTLNLTSYSPDTLNPLTTKYECVRDVLYLAYEGLFIVNEDLTVTPVLASSYKTQDNNTVYRINLKKGVRFHDSSAFTSKDVVATFDYIRMYETAYSYALSNVAHYEADGDYAVVIRLKKPQSGFLCNLDFPILSSGLTGGDFAPESKTYSLNGTGRYKYSRTEPYIALIMEKNTNWHKKDPVYIPEVCVRYVNDNDAILYAFDSGESDMITTQRGRWGEFPYSTKSKAYEITTTSYVYIGMNTNSSVFSDASVRHGLEAMIDKEDIVDSVMFSHALASDSPVSSKAYFYRSDDDNTDYRKKAIARNTSVFVLYNTESKYKENIARQICSQLTDAGVDAQLSGVDYDTYLSRISSGDYQIYIGEVNMSKDYDLSFMFGETVHGEEAQDIENTEICDYTDSKLRDIIGNINSAKDDDAKSMACNNLVRFIGKNLPQIPLFHKNEAVFLNPRIKGKPNLNLTNLYADIGSIYIK